MSDLVTNTNELQRVLSELGSRVVDPSQLETENKTLIGAINELKNGTVPKLDFYTDDSKEGATVLDLITLLETSGYVGKWVVVNLTGRIIEAYGLTIETYGPTVYNLAGFNLQNGAIANNTNSTEGWEGLNWSDFQELFSSPISGTDLSSYLEYNEYDQLLTENKTVFNAINELHLWANDQDDSWLGKWRFINEPTQHVAGSPLSVSFTSNNTEYTALQYIAIGPPGLYGIYYLNSNGSIPAYIYPADSMYGLTPGWQQEEYKNIQISAFFGGDTNCEKWLRDNIIKQTIVGRLEPKQDRKDDSLKTEDKTVVGAINELLNIFNEGGADGKDGEDGVGISDITKTSSSGKVDTYTIILTDGNTKTFTVTNGSDGKTPEKGTDYFTSTEIDTIATQAAGKINLSSYATQQWVTDQKYTTNTGTVTQIMLGSGLTGGTITTSGTIGLDEDLQAIAALSGTSGFLKKTAANTWTLDTNTYLTSHQSLANYVTLDGTQAISGKKIFGNSTGASTITADLDAMIVGINGTRVNTTGFYYPGIAFNHMWKYNNGTTYSNSPQSWIGLRLVDTASAEASSLVFAMLPIGQTAGARPVEKMCLTPNGYLGIGTQYPTNHLEVAGNSLISGIFKVENAEQSTDFVQINGTQVSLSKSGKGSSLEYDSGKKALKFVFS